VPSCRTIEESQRPQRVLLRQARLARPQHTDSHGTIILCPEKGKEITAKLLHINGEMRHGLGTVHKDERADVVSSFTNFLYRIDQSQDV